LGGGGKVPWTSRKSGTGAAHRRKRDAGKLVGRGDKGYEVKRGGWRKKAGRDWQSLIENRSFAVRARDRDRGKITAVEITKNR